MSHFDALAEYKKIVARQLARDLASVEVDLIANCLRWSAVKIEAAIMVGNGYATVEIGARKLKRLDAHQTEFNFD